MVIAVKRIAVKRIAVKRIAVKRITVKRSVIEVRGSVNFKQQQMGTPLSQFWKFCFIRHEPVPKCPCTRLDNLTGFAIPYSLDLTL